MRINSYLKRKEEAGRDVLVEPLLFVLYSALKRATLPAIQNGTKTDQRMRAIMKRATKKDFFLSIFIM